MVIGIDIDDVITNSSDTIEKYVLEDKNSENLKKHMVPIMKGNPTDPEVLEFCKKTYLKVFKETTIKENAREVIQRLLDKGNEIILLTARGDSYKWFIGSEEITINYLKQNNIPYTKLIFNAMNKEQACIDNKIDVMIDDSVEQCERIHDIGIKSIVFTSNVNKGIITSIDRVNDWKELENKLNFS